MFAIKGTQATNQVVNAVFTHLRISSSIILYFCILYCFLINNNFVHKEKSCKLKSEFFANMYEES